MYSNRSVRAAGPLTWRCVIDLLAGDIRRLFVVVGTMAQRQGEEETEPVLGSCSRCGRALVGGYVTRPGVAGRQCLNKPCSVHETYFTRSPRGGGWVELRGLYELAEVLIRMDDNEYELVVKRVTEVVRGG